MHHNPGSKTQTADMIGYYTGEGVPVHFYLDVNLMPDEHVIQPLKELSKMPEVNDYIVALPDLHFKSRNLVPTGLVTVSRGHIIPFAVDKGINCGIRMMTLPLSATEITTSQIDDFYAAIMKRVPVDKHLNPVISSEEFGEIIESGAEWAEKRFKTSEDLLKNYEKRGNLFRESDFTKKEIYRSIPPAAYKKGPKRLGILGGGNHFLELQQITHIVHEKIAAQWGLQQDQLMLMLHSGTGGLGGAVMKYFHQASKTSDSEKARKKEQQKQQFLNFPPHDIYRSKWLQEPHLYGIPADSATARHFLAAVYAIANFGFVNRAVISHHAEQALREVCKDKNLRLNLLYDSSHVTIQPERHNGHWYWVHRNGANQAMPASYMQDHEIYRSTGQPIPVPGSMGTDSYIAAAAEGTLRTFCSANHGAGRLLDKPEARNAFQEQAVIDSMKKEGIRLYHYGKGRITEQAPDAFKNIENVVRVMKQYHIAEPVAKVRPLAVLKG